MNRLYVAPQFSVGTPLRFVFTTHALNDAPYTDAEFNPDSILNVFDDRPISNIVSVEADETRSEYELILGFEGTVRDVKLTKILKVPDPY